MLEDRRPHPAIQPHPCKPQLLCVFVARGCRRPICPVVLSSSHTAGITDDRAVMLLHIQTPPRVDISAIVLGWPSARD
jgi:hypothetical protein